ncbi:MAG: hypothetical protein A2664_00265 [Candidatus Taylorbacteria bacterium RIFCSPHIGHO2_01_FULL_46_22b]|uniref:Uncharacterized protein n=1 Tax=Candidatus Taylorbacteria bacterium RIFCSPHIGHO2_01_FULL_46_22b TaxID=1802301 RepID=A0A1G2M459_9BACT|nr:MAG: hypothetical protein A2664_00265 [Candidatus Taylorbacteria bacterium RIFCSPHIGHO2_01_FULL_46_22b]
MSTADTDVLFTLEGRKAIQQRKPDWLACERGFLDHSDGCPITDKATLELLIDEPARKAVLKFKFTFIVIENGNYVGKTSCEQTFSDTTELAQVLAKFAAIQSAARLHQMVVPLYTGGLLGRSMLTMPQVEGGLGPNTVLVITDVEPIAA